MKAQKDAWSTAERTCDVWGRAESPQMQRRWNSAWRTRGEGPRTQAAGRELQERRPRRVVAGASPTRALWLRGRQAASHELGCSAEILGHVGGAARPPLAVCGKVRSGKGRWKRWLLIPGNRDVMVSGHPGCEGCSNQEILCQEECSREKPRVWLDSVLAGAREGPDIASQRRASTALVGSPPPSQHKQRKR